ncbi:hypothetical protein FXO38_00557 [Capsicum annuum]|nr:hypothetical protein FXO37_09341 [Capsicum annuum]KAF3683869.1 hypothetical protein FXO38_00557 [Capsicum annuum]
MEKEAESRRKKEVLEKVGQVIASIKDAKHVDEVICALHCLALRLFPLDSHSLAGSVNELYREQMWLVIGWHVSPFLRGCTSIMCFFLRGQAIEVVQKLVPCLQWRGSSNGNTRSIHSNSERLLVLCLLDNLGVTQIARELSTYCEEDLAHEELKQIISRVVQLLTSIPDKAQAGTPKAFSSRHPF